MGDELPASVETVVVGAGQAGLIMSYHLGRAGREHVVLDRRETLGGGWQDRWDAFQLVSPNWTTGLPASPTTAPTPTGTCIATTWSRGCAGYAAAIEAPVRLGTAVERLTPTATASSGSASRPSQGPIEHATSIVATGAFHIPKVLRPRPRSRRGSTRSTPTTTGTRTRCRRAASCSSDPGRPGVQLAEELQEAGRDVTLSVGHCGRAPRRYRGRDFFWWMRQLVDRGTRARHAAADRRPAARSAAAVRVQPAPVRAWRRARHEPAAVRGSRDPARRAVRGRRRGARAFAEDLADNLAVRRRVLRPALPDAVGHVRRAGRASMSRRTTASRSTSSHPRSPSSTSRRPGISSVLWTTGYAPDYRWLDLPILGDFGLPRHVRGVSDVPGLTFLGLLWQHNQGSANLAGVASDAEYLGRAGSTDRGTFELHGARGP